MQLVDLLDELERAGTLAKLYQAGAATLAVYAQREIFHTYQALLALPAYTDQPSRAVAATAETCRVHVTTVYRALRVMEQQV